MNEAQLQQLSNAVLPTLRWSNAKKLVPGVLHPPVMHTRVLHGQLHNILHDAKVALPYLPCAAERSEKTGNGDSIDALTHFFLYSGFASFHRRPEH